jgi:V8-like Glu-specific endopeptidase
MNSPREMTMFSALRRRRVRPNLENLETRDLPSLTPIAAGAGYPFTAIVKLQVMYPDGQQFVGSGAMVDRFHVLTAGHMLYAAEHGGLIRGVLVTPELNGYQQPFGSVQGTYVRVDSTFAAFEQSHPDQTAPGDHDVGLITLASTLGDATGWLDYGYDNNNADFSAGSIYNTAGYPATGGYNGQQMEFSAGPLLGLAGNGTALAYAQNSITTFPGQSGSPIWRYNPSSGDRVIYAVLAGGDGRTGFSTRITSDIFNELQSWRANDALPGSASFASPAPGGNAYAASANFAASFSAFNNEAQADATTIAPFTLDDAPGSAPPSSSNQADQLPASPPPTSTPAPSTTPTVSPPTASTPPAATPPASHPTSTPQAHKTAQHVTPPHSHVVKHHKVLPHGRVQHSHHG